MDVEVLIELLTTSVMEEEFATVLFFLLLGNEGINVLFVEITFEGGSDADGGDE